MSADGGDVQCAEFAPIGKNRRENGSSFVRSELKKTIARSTCEGILQSHRKFGIKERGVSNLDYVEMAVWS
jgi:hypothetical protein